MKSFWKKNWISQIFRENNLTESWFVPRLQFYELFCEINFKKSCTTWFQVFLTNFEERKSVFYFQEFFHEIIFKKTHCGNYGNSLTHIFGKNLVKVTVLLMKLLISWFDEIFFSESKSFIFPQCGKEASHNLKIFRENNFEERRRLQIHEFFRENKFKKSCITTVYTPQCKDC